MHRCAVAETDRIVDLAITLRERMHGREPSPRQSAAFFFLFM